MKKSRNLVNGVVIIAPALLIYATALFSQHADTVVQAVTNGMQVCLLTTSTNTWISSTNHTIDSVEYMVDRGTLTNVVTRLAKEGHICAVYGHQWREGRPGEGEGSAYGGFYADYHPGTYYRTCRICGKCESRSINDWK